MTLIALLAASLAVASGSTVSVPSPGFDRFPAPVLHVRRAAPVRIVSARDRRSRSALREAAAHGADFAGHWTLAEIGCGASCIEVAAVDKASGRVVWFPASICCWPLAVSEPLSFRADSRLLLVNGVLDEEGESARREFVFDEHGFTPVMVPVDGGL